MLFDVSEWCQAWMFFKTENKIEFDIIPRYFNYRKYS